MKRSSKLPAFAGRCRAKCLTDAAVFAANEALEKAAFAPAQQQSQRADNLLTLLLLILALWCLSNCQSARPATEAQRRPAEQADPRTWHESDYLD